MVQAPRTVTLQHLAWPEIVIHMDASLRADGSLQLAGHDVGSRVEELTGDFDYEYFLTVGAEQLPRVVAALLGHTRSGDGDAVEHGDLLELLRAAYDGGRFTGRNDFADFLRALGVEFELYSY